MENNNGKQYYLPVRNTLTGKTEIVYVSEEIYRAYKSFDRAEKKRKQRMWRCKIPREGFSERQKSFLKRCDKKCSECPYGEQVKDSVVSLDALREQNAEIEDYTYDPASVMAEQARSAAEEAALSEAIRRLPPRQKEIVELYFFAKKTEYEIAGLLHISQQAVNDAVKKAIKNLKEFL